MANRVRLLLPALLLLLSACTKNEFMVQVEQASGVVPTEMQLVYYASDSRRGWVVTRDMFPGSTQQSVCATRNPALCYVYSPTRLLTIFWAERGDKILLHCRNGLWVASGNETTDSLALWQSRNRNILQANAFTDINRQVATYVRQNPDKRLSAILLYAYYNARHNSTEYEQLRSLLRGKAADPDLLRASGVLPPALRPSEKPLAALHLRTLGDSLSIIRTSAAAATILLCWNNARLRTERIGILRPKLANRPDIQVADINMQADTLSWRHTVAAENMKNWHRLWAPGAEQNSELTSLALPGPDFIIVTDRSGKSIYRGTDADKAADAALRQH